MPPFSLRLFVIALLPLVAGCARRDAAANQAALSASVERAAPKRDVAAPEPSPLARTEARGRELYTRYCQLCHAPEGTGYAADNAPSLVSRTFLESATDDFIAQGIRLGRPATAMAAYGKERGGPLDDSDIAAIVAFLRSKGPSARPLPEAGANGDPARGAVIYGRECQACHGTAAARSTAPHLHNAEFLRAATPAFLRYAIVHGRPPTPMPAYGKRLEPQAIDDVVAWIQSLPRAATPALPAEPLVPEDLPLVINPKGTHPTFTLREGRFVSSEQVKRALDAKQRIVIVDARSPSDWIQFRIPGAVPIPYYDTERLKRIPNDGTWIIAYCACPHHASGEVVDALRRLNYKNNAVLDEGILFWRDRGYPLDGVSAKPAAPTKPSAPAKPGSPAKPGNSAKRSG